jgi:hypothetical protein
MTEKSKLHKGTKLMQYIGKSDRLKYGEFYTYAELAEVANISAVAMRVRVRKRNIVDDNILFKERKDRALADKNKTSYYRYSSLISNLETREQKLSDSYLRRRL